MERLDTEEPVLLSVRVDQTKHQYSDCVRHRPYRGNDTYDWDKGFRLPGKRGRDIEVGKGRNHRVESTVESDGPLERRGV